MSVEVFDKLVAEAQPQIRNRSMSISNMLASAAQNAPSSLLQVAKDTVAPFADPVGTAESLKDLGLGLLQLAIPGEQPQEAKAKAVGEYFADRYGGLEEVKRTFATDPAGFLADASIILTGGAALATRAPGTVGRVAERARGLAESIDPINLAVSGAQAVSSGVSRGTPALVGLTTGTSGQSLQEAVRAGREGGTRQERFLSSMRGQEDATEIVTDAKDALSTIRGNATSEFKAGKEALQLGTKKIDFAPVAEKIDDLEKSFAFMDQTTLSPNGQRKLNQIKRFVNDWSKSKGMHTAQGLDVLKRKIDNIYPTGFNPGDQAAVVAQARDAVKKAIVEQVPDYNKVMAPYEKARKLELEIQRTLSLGDKNLADTALRKLQSVMRDNVNTNFGQRLNLVKELEDVGDYFLIPRIAGQELSSLAPRGLARVPASGVGLSSFTDPVAMAALPFTSPRIMGEAANLVGRGQRLLNVAQSKIGTPLQRQAIRNVSGEILATRPRQVSRAVGVLAGEEQRQEELEALRRMLNPTQQALMQ